MCVNWLLFLLFKDPWHFLVCPCITMAGWVSVAGIPSDGGRAALGQKVSVSSLSWDGWGAFRFTGHSWWLHQCLDCKARPWEQEAGRYTQFPHGKLKVQNIDSILWHLMTRYHRLCWSYCQRSDRERRHIWGFSVEFFRTGCSGKLNRKEWVSM